MHQPPETSALQPGEEHAPLHAARQEAQPFVRLTEKSLSELSDTGLERYIRESGRLMLEAEERYQRESFLADKGERDGLWLTQRHALQERARRPAIVAAMEAERGLS